ncbi:AraC family transcriptional regulator [Paenalcaligenes niemegkensis]|uniref:helix-turn-helix domain-containing protein n=1 Tax=Paenalcaligenes niemegkensis TaxID=2895469 RepID=UPI001EE9149B|nr:AraC family transcriptional regulator [Paenalcaligenes niemegkensis]MCQ9618311.1 AraC family transcriptional regulator [Paenalcaligenes niemegkensis]
MMISDDIPSETLESRIFDLFMATVEHNSELKNFNSLLYSLRSRPTDPRIRRAITYMQNNVSNGLDLDHLAVQCGLSRAHFFELFKRNTNLTPAVYANVLRVESAIKSLSTHHHPISDISYDIGFSAPGHFTRFFRQHLGITPSEFRRAVDVFEQNEVFI